MLLQQTIEKLYSLNLKTMAAALTEELTNGRPDLSFEERSGLLVDREWSRTTEALHRALKSGQTAPARLWKTLTTELHAGSTGRSFRIFSVAAGS